MRPSIRTARLPELVAEIEVIPYDSPLCGDEEFRCYVRLQASRVRAALRRDEDVAAGLHVLVRSCMTGPESVVFVEILGRSPDGEALVSDFDPHPYLAVRGRSIDCSPSGSGRRGRAHGPRPTAEAGGTRRKNTLSPRKYQRSLPSGSQWSPAW